MATLRCNPTGTMTMNPDDIVTIQTSDGSDFVTVPASMADVDPSWIDDITVGDSIKLSGYTDEISGDSCDTFTYTHTTKQFDDIKWDDLFTTPQEIKVGDRVITADMVDKLAALIDMIEGLDEDNALKELFNTQLGMNKIRGNNDET